MRRPTLALLSGALLVLALALPQAASAAAKRPTVAGELRRLADAGAIPAETAQADRDVYDAARAALRRLTGLRRAELKAVLANVDAVAAGRMLTASRAPSVFLTLKRNRAWWAGGARVPRSGERVSFADSQLVWQYYPGQGLQIQWLGTFGKANGLWQWGRADEQLRALLDEALGLAASRAGGIAFEYLFRFNGGRPPWVSGLAQGTALTALARASARLRDPRYLDAARSALGIFRTAPPKGVRVTTAAGAHYLQYSYAPRLHIINGFVQSLNGLEDFAAIGDDAEGRALFAAGEAQLRVELPAFDTGAWSLYSSAGVESDLGYHQLLRDFLTGLCTRLTKARDRAAKVVPEPAATDPAAAGGAAPTPASPPATAPAAVPDPQVYCATADRFTADLHTAPVVELRPGTLRKGRTGRIAFTLSKVSSVAITLVRDGKVVLSQTGRFGRGRNTITVRPRSIKPLEVRLQVTDLAGNGAATAGTITVRRPPAKTPVQHRNPDR